MSQVTSPLARLPKEAGIAAGLIGLLVAALGTGLAFAGWPVAGYWIGLGGALLGLVGVALHFALNWRTIFHATRE